MTSPINNSSSARELPHRANLDVLKREAKRRLIELRCTDKAAKLSDSQFEIARAYGFASWRALKSTLEQSGARSNDNCLGDWIGQRPDGLHLALHVSAEDGETKATIDSPDSNAYGLRAHDFDATQDDMHFYLPNINVVFLGKWAKQQDRWQGTWRQDGLDFPIEFTRGNYPPRPEFQGLDGTWEGYLGDTGLRLFYRVVTDTRGTFAICDSPDRSGSGFPVKAIESNAASVVLRTASTTLSGRVETDKIVAIFSRDGKSWPITLRRREPGAAPLLPRSTELPQAALMALVGDYGERGLSTSIAFEGGQLSARFASGIRVDLIPVGAREFHLKSGDGKLLFDIEPDGNVSRLMFSKGTHKISVERRL